jgi:hypothetical protein
MVALSIYTVKILTCYRRQLEGDFLYWIQTELGFETNYPHSTTEIKGALRSVFVAENVLSIAPT